MEYREFLPEFFCQDTINVFSQEFGELHRCLFIKSITGHHHLVSDSVCKKCKGKRPDDRLKLGLKANIIGILNTREFDVDFFFDSISKKLNKDQIKTAILTLAKLQVISLKDLEDKIKRYNIDE
jgi:hypothetical protein